MTDVDYRVGYMVSSDSFWWAHAVFWTTVLAYSLLSIAVYEYMT